MLSAYDYGGAIYNRGKLTINQSIIRHGPATKGSGIYNEGRLEINESRIEDNTGAGIENRASLVLNDSTIQNNNNDNESFSGGGITNTATATAVINRSLFVGNRAAFGAGLWNGNNATAIIKDSTFSANIAGSEGGGISHSSGTLNLVNSLVSGNHIRLLAGRGREIFRYTGAIAGNQENNLFGYNGITTSHAVDGIGVTLGNLTATGNGSIPTALNRIISPLRENGGPTRTHALLSGSPAIDASVISYGSFPFLKEGCYVPPLFPFKGGYRNDQRGISRPQGDACDIGAYEHVSSQFFIVPATNGKTVIFSL